MRRLGCGGSACGGCAGAEEIGEQAIGARHQLRKLAVEGEGDINVGALAGMGDEESAALRILAGIGGFSEGGVAGVPVIEEAVAAFFEPSCKIGRGDAIGGGEERVAGIEQPDGGLFIDNALADASHGQWERRGKVGGLVEDEEGSAALDEGFEERKAL